MNKPITHAGSSTPVVVLDYRKPTAQPVFARAAIFIATLLHLVLGTALLGFALAHLRTSIDEHDQRGARHAIAAAFLAMLLFAAGISMFSHNYRGWVRGFVLLFISGIANLAMMAYWSHVLWINRSDYLNDNWVAAVVCCALCATVSLGGAYILCLSKAVFGVAQHATRWRKRICVAGLLICWTLLAFTMKVVIGMVRV
jgi:hypothetical protein